MREQIIALLRELTGGPTLEWYDETIQRIKALDQELCIKVLRGLLHDADDTIRCYAGEVLMRISAASELEYVLDLLDDPDEDVRYNTSLLMIEYPDQRSCSKLVHILKYDPDPDVRANAVIALRNIGNDQATEALQWASAHDFAADFEGEPINQIALRSIAEIGRKRGPGQTLPPADV